MIFPSGLRIVHSLSHYKSTSIALLFFLSSISVCSWSQTVESALPELGDNATQFLSPDQEAHIGQLFLQQLISAPNYINDEEIKHYLNTIARKIGENAALRGTTLQLNLLANNELNAFAVPGGYITFHSGLLLSTESESELASVIGHEIAHISQRHLPRLLAKADAQKIPLILATIGSVLIGGQAGVAGITLANASAISNQLSYSRDFEREADAVGMTIMASSGYDPRGMGQFFNKLQRFNLITTKDVPEFLRSHPLSYTRIAEAESRLSRFPNVSHESSLAFHFVKAKIQALYSGRAEDAVDILSSSAEKSTGSEKVASLYGLALAKGRLRNYDEGMEILNPLIDGHPDQIFLQIAAAILEKDAGKTGEAVSRLKSVVEKSPDELYLQHYYLEALLAHGDAATAKKVARYQIRRHPAETALYRSLSKANVAMNNLVEAHQADAEYLALIGKYQPAVDALKLALRDNATNSEYFTKSIEARITQLERLVERAKNTKLPG